MSIKMNKASKHIQNGYNNGQISSASIMAPSLSPLAPIKSPLLDTNLHHQQNVIDSIMNILPDNRPITSLQIVEDYEKCPRNFTAISRTYDQDADADLWRENTILFGRQTKRYLCLSKTEGLPEYVVETLKVIAEKIPPPKEFSLLSRTADTEQKAWRKRQISYKLSKRGSVTHAVTDIILCSKRKIAPDGFKLAGDINGVLVCYKTSAIPVRLPPPVPGLKSSETNASQQSSQITNGANATNGNSKSEVEQALNRLKLNGKSQNNNGPPKQPLPPVPNDADHDYEEILSSYQIKSPCRPAPPLPAGKSTTASQYIGTLGSYTELEGVPFILNPTLKRANDVEMLSLPKFIDFKECDYDFNLERQVLCTMKSSSSKNPFFN